MLFFWGVRLPRGFHDRMKTRFAAIQELPHLRQWRREGKAVEVRMLRVTWQSQWESRESARHHLGISDDTVLLLISLLP